MRNPLQPHRLQLTRPTGIKPATTESTARNIPGFSGLSMGSTMFLIAPVRVGVRLSTPGRLPFVLAPAKIL